MPGDITADLLLLLRGSSGGSGLKVVKVETTEPNPITLTFEGTKLALDLDIFEVPVSLYPLRKGDRFFAFPIVGNTRWGLLKKLNGGTITLATMQSGSSLSISGVDKTYSGNEVIIPPYFAVGASSSNGYLTSGDIRPLQTGDVVSVTAIQDGDVIKYVVLNRY